MAMLLIVMANMLHRIGLAVIYHEGQPYESARQTRLFNFF